MVTGLSCIRACGSRIHHGRNYKVYLWQLLEPIVFAAVLGIEPRALYIDSQATTPASESTAVVKVN